LIDAANQFTSQTLSPPQQHALKIHAQVLELAAIGGTDYSATIATTLIEDAETLARAMSVDQLRAAHVQIAYNNAAEAGATVPDAIGDKLEAAKHIALLDPKTLADIELLLRCKLGRAEGYPQT
jgi:hypothetical protein